MGKLSNTAALTGAPPSEATDHTVSVRGINNGYIVRTSCCGRDGDYSSSETFTKNRPNISPPGVKYARGGGSTLDGNLSAAMLEVKK